MRFILFTLVFLILLVWAFALWLMNEPIGSSDSLEFQRYQFEILVFMVGLWLPWLLVLGLVVYAIRTLCGERPRWLDAVNDGLIARLMLFVSLAWLVVSLVVLSEPGVDLLIVLLWLSFTGALALSWLGFAPLLVRRTWKQGRPKISLTLVYLILPPLAVALFATLTVLQIPLKARFELSQAALSDLAVRCSRDAWPGPETRVPDSCLGSHRAGLFIIDSVSQQSGCVVSSYCDFHRV
jgi:hypothetical protein